MKETFDNFVHWYNLRKADITSIVFEATNGVVVDGPFKGMKLLQQGAWGDGHPAAKVLALYESELYPYVEDAISQSPDVVLNIGCAEGFYGIGLAIRTGVKTVLIDPWADVLNIARANAKANSVNNVLFSTDSSIEAFRSFTNKYQKPFIVMDCEGGELGYLNLDLFPELNQSIILVESHDCVTPGITDELISRFSNSHNITVISQGAKNPHKPEHIMKQFGDLDKMLLCCEERPSTMYWLYMVPKQ